MPPTHEDFTWVKRPPRVQIHQTGSEHLKYRVISPAPITCLKAVQFEVPLQFFAAWNKTIAYYLKNEIYADYEGLVTDRIQPDYFPHA